MVTLNLLSDIRSEKTDIRWYMLLIAVLYIPLGIFIACEVINNSSLEVWKRVVICVVWLYGLSVTYFGISRLRSFRVEGKIFVSNKGIRIETPKGKLEAPAEEIYEFAVSYNSVSGRGQHQLVPNSVTIKLKDYTVFQGNIEIENRKHKDLFKKELYLLRETGGFKLKIENTFRPRWWKF